MYYNKKFNLVLYLLNCDTFMANTQKPHLNLTVTLYVQLCNVNAIAFLEVLYYSSECAVCP